VGDHAETDPVNHRDLANRGPRLPGRPTDYMVSMHRGGIEIRRERDEPDTSDLATAFRWACELAGWGPALHIYRNRPTEAAAPP
jgi:hypothetical protein